MTQIFIVPVENLLIDNPFRMGKFFLYPSLSVLDNTWDRLQNGITSQENSLYTDILKRIKKEFLEREDITFILYEGVYKNKNVLNTPQKLMWYCDEICDYANISLNYLRMSQCVIGKFDQLPGIPGMRSEGIKVVYTFDTTGNKIVEIPGSVANEIRTGLGCYPSRDFGEDNYNDTLYKILFSESENEVSEMCKIALNKICKAFYITDFNICFTYLWTILESISSNDYLQFKKVKSKILPFISTSKSDYHDKAEWLRNISENTRTEIVHNGVSIYSIFQTEGEVISLLQEILNIITQYIIKVYETGLTNFGDLEEKRNELRANLGV